MLQLVAHVRGLTNLGESFGGTLTQVSETETWGARGRAEVQMFVCKDADPSTSSAMTMSPGGMRGRPGKAKRPDRSGALCFLQRCLLAVKEERRHGNVRLRACFNAKGCELVRPVLTN